MGVEFPTIGSIFEKITGSSGPMEAITKMINSLMSKLMQAFMPEMKEKKEEANPDKSSNETPPSITEPKGGGGTGTKTPLKLI